MAAKRDHPHRTSKGSGSGNGVQGNAPTLISPMTLDEKFDYWLDAAQYDLASAESNLREKRFLYVAFMCQQAIEKLVKGLYTLHLDDNPPLVHEINTIFDKFKGRLRTEKPPDKEKLFSILTSYYLNNRYPNFKKKMHEQMNEIKATELLALTKEAFAWLLTLKP
jgi:HEPN domain-containing protein